MCIALLLAAAALLETGLGPVPGFEKGWTFVRDGREPAVVDIPHDGAIDFGFDWNRWDSGCGALPYAGHGEYVKRVTLERGDKSWRLEVDGAMSCSKIFVNGRKAAERPFGYAAFVVPLDGFLVDGGNEFRITVDPPADSSRWYPGFGLYREIRLVAARPDHVEPGSVSFVYSNVTAAAADVTVSYAMSKGGTRRRTFTVREPKLWSPESPHLYSVDLEGETFRYGIRTLRFDPTKGFFLNGRHRQMRGVCLHHDLGLFGAAFVREEASRRLDLLKEMGCDAIRTSHNPPSQGFLDLCDEKGFLVMAESFDEWNRPKVAHGMSEMWESWHQTEIETVVRNARRHPSVVMWSIGNELCEDVRPEYEAEGARIAKELSATVRRLDPEGRPVTAGHYVDATATNAIGAATEVFGGNYLPHRYAGFCGKQGVIGTETCSTASSRGVYDLQTTNLLSVSRQVLSYDLYPVHGNDYPPDVEFAAQEANPHCFGEFVWTGFDYIGEPDPWRGKARSSYFGIFDLAGFPKDRYWLYKAQWRSDVPSAHILPHWNWKTGDAVPVHVYSSGDEAELFVNGVSQGRRRRGTGWTSHRFVWEKVPYAAGEISVRTWRGGRPWAEDRIRTSGPFDRFVFRDERRGKYLFRSAEAVDAKGVFVPTAAEPVSADAPAGYRFLGACNGDPTDKTSLRSPQACSFSGRALLVFKELEQTCPVSSLERGFLEPPMSARPQTWWHWMNGNVTKEGITADLEAMKEIGLGGATLFDAGCGVPSGPLKFASPEWYDYVKHAAAEARRLRIEICLPNCSGWSSSGGPWNPAANNMKELVRTERRYAGPRHVCEKLPSLPNAHGFAADIAVLAVPVPPAERDTMEKAGGVVTSPSEYVREIAFPEPFAADGLFFRLEHDWLWEVAGDVRVETSDDGTSYAELMTADATLALRAGWDRTERYRPFPREVKARFYRLTFSFRVIGRDPGDHERVKKTVVASVRVGRAKSLSNLCDKTFAKRMTVTADPDTAKADQVVAKDAVRVLKLSADGMLDWDVPAGEWRVIRLGFAANGKKNHPASDFGGGFEVDKLSPEALDFHFEQYAAKLVRHLGPLAGDVPSGLAGILVDSYEIGAQNWTQGFEDAFRKRRGYDLTPYLPVLAGVVVGSVDESERFLSDFRRTIADLFVAGYSGALAKKCHQYGLKLWLEPYGNCPCDDLEYGDEVDLPMAEFWSQAATGDRFVDTGNARIPGYLAHVWGRRYVGAEAFTSCPPGGGRWTTTPFALKAQGDRAFTKGINRLIFHRFCQQPYVKDGSFAAPGFTLGLYGIHLDRTQTWWKQGRPYMDYLARCQWMLQEGRCAADVLFWHGEEAPSRGGHVVGFPEDYRDHPVPSGFEKDVCSTKALKALAVSDGKVVAPGGTRYEMLVLQDVTEMSAATLEAIGRLVDAGATVVAPRMPTKATGLWHYPNGDAEIRSRAAAIWKKGVVTGGANEGIAARGLTPDVVCLSAAEGLTNELAWIHRRYERGVDAYFVACPNERAGDFTCSFRTDGREPELWDAESGTVGLKPKSWRCVDGRTEVTFALPPSGSTFVVFRRPTALRADRDETQAVPAEEQGLPLSWCVTFPVGWYAGGAETKTVEMKRLVDWTTLQDDDLRYFSGTVRYETDIPEMSVQQALRAQAAGRRVWLDLGDVKNFADVTVNGRRFPTLWRPPFRADVTGAIKPGGNHVTVRITNLWPNRMIGDERLCAPDCEWTADGGLREIPAFIREGRPSPTGRKTFATWHHWKKDDTLLPSGLLGPVRLMSGRSCP